MEYAFRTISLRVFTVFIVLALMVGTMWAQGGTGELTGLVTDPSGAVVSGVQVTLTNSATGDKRTTATSGAGIYRFSALPVVGSYTLDVAPKGFKGVRVADVVVTVGTVTTRDVKLELGAATETIEVQAGTQLVQTTDAAVSQLIDRRVWEQMPLEARNANDFINLVAGAVPEQIAGGTFRGAAVNGTRTGTGNYLVEGVDNNEQGQGGVSLCGTQCGQGGANTSISPDAIQEYRVITHDFAAEYGKAGGFVTDTVLKGGTNQWHGSAFEYNRIQALTANDWFSNNAGNKDHLVRNQFGGSAGGPIIKDKTFFFGTVEVHRLRQSTPVSGTSMTQQFYNFVNTGQFATFVQNNLCGGPCTVPTTVGPIFQSLLQKWPQAMPLVNSSITCNPALPANQNPTGCVGQGLFTTNLVYPVPVYDTATESSVNPLDQYRFSIKVDHKIGQNDQVNGVYLFEDTKTHCNFCGSDTIFGVPEDNPNRAQTAGITWTHTFSPTVLNQAKVGYVRRVANFVDPGSAGVPEFFTIDALVSGFGASTAIPQFFTDNEFQAKDDISVTKGKHSLKFGGEYRRTRNGSSFQADRNGHFTPWSAEDLITDSVFSDQLDNFFGTSYGGWYYAGAAVNPTNGQLPDFYRGYRANEVAMYAQDDWRVNSRLTLNLGLRWEYFGPPHNFKPNIDSNYYFGTPVTPIPCFTAGVQSPCTNQFFPSGNPYYAYEASARPEVKNSNLWNKDLNNFGPRVGFAWDVLGTSKLVLRAGGGVFYDRLYNNVFENIRFNAPFYADETAGIFQSGVAVGPLKQPGLLTIPFTSNAQFISSTLFPAGLPKPVPRHIDQNLVTAYYEQYSFGLQYELAKDIALETNYIGTLGRKLVGILNRNTFDGRTSGAGSTQRPNQLFNSDNARGNYYDSNYNALDVTLRKRFSHGLTLNANYSYSKALDQLSDVFRAKTAQISATDVQNVHLDYGPSDFDVRHRVVASYNYDVPLMKTSRWLGGWQLNGIVSWNTGSPIGLLDAPASGHDDGNRDGVRTDRPAFIGSGSLLGSIVGKEEVPAGGNKIAYVYLDPNQYARVINAFDSPPTGQNFVRCPMSMNGGFWCNLGIGRGSVPGPMFMNVDFGVSKNFKITESTKLRFDANFFDLFNHPNFTNPGAGGDGSNNFFDPNFGRSLSTYGDTGGHRVTQLALRFEF